MSDIRLTPHGTKAMIWPRTAAEQMHDAEEWAFDAWTRIIDKGKPTAQEQAGFSRASRHLEQVRSDLAFAPFL